MFKYDLPENRGVMNGIKRAKQFSEIRYHSIKMLPAAYLFRGYPNGEKKYFQGGCAAGFPHKGLPYSSAIKYQKLIGYHVSIESFMTAVLDPFSILYKKNLIGGERRNAAAWYGTVCSSLASYVWDLPIQYICATWDTIEGVEALGQPPLEELKLLDTLLNSGHVAVITGIERENDGKVTRVEVTESTLPNCRATWFTVEQFTLYWYQNETAPYKVYRRKDHSMITYTPCPFVPIARDEERGIEGDASVNSYSYNKALLPDHGNRSNYLLGEEPVVIDVLNDTWTAVEVIDGYDNKRLYPVKNHIVVPEISECGYYRATAIKENGERSEDVLFAVVGYKIPISKSAYRPGEKMNIYFDSNDPSGKPAYYSFSDRNTCVTIRREAITPETVKDGVLEVVTPERAGEYYLSLGVKNEFGIYASGLFEFDIAVE